MAELAPPVQWGRPRNGLDRTEPGTGGICCADVALELGPVSFNLIWSNQGKGTSTITHTGGGIFVSG